ncbi:uncharacterized protein LOC132626437 isoform X1 [Lycium barbarum]|uniref:uncharacterized protein LOC132626437 isoform X1 n=1 Tax=Lycium barbarum TaxID=112863 RepID=UPI00293EEFE1|nr:uncharacterized protein LOC132626437 isoform X1 [Lycium barbarum]
MHICLYHAKHALISFVEEGFSSNPSSRLLFLSHITKLPVLQSSLPVLDKSINFSYPLSIDTPPRIVRVWRSSRSPNPFLTKAALGRDMQMAEAFGCKKLSQTVFLEQCVDSDGCNHQCINWKHALL